MLIFIFLDKKSFKEKRKEYRSHERKYENNPEAISEDHVPSSASSSSSYKPKKIAGIIHSKLILKKSYVIGRPIFLQFFLF